MKQEILILYGAHSRWVVVQVVVVVVLAFGKRFLK